MIQSIYRKINNPPKNRDQIQHKIEELLASINSNFSNAKNIESAQILTNEQQQKLTVNMLFKVSAYFIQLTEMCMTQINSSQLSQIKSKLESNKTNIQNLFSKKFQNFKKTFLLQEENKTQRIAAMIENIKINKPKHPVSSFFFFFKEKSREISQKSGQKVGSKIAKIVGDIWKKMDFSEKIPYQKLAQQTRDKYDQEMKIFKLQFAEDISELKKIKKNQKKLKKNSVNQQIELQHSKVSSEGNEIKNQAFENSSDFGSDVDMLSNSIQESSPNGSEQESTPVQNTKKIGKEVPLKIDKPKAPVSSFFIYYRQNGKNLSKIHNIPLGPKMIKISSETWKNLSSEQKQPYNIQAELTRRKYYEEMNKFKRQNAEQLRLYKKMKQETKKLKKLKEQ